MEDPSIDDIISTVSRKQFPHRNHGSEVKVGTRAAIDDQVHSLCLMLCFSVS